jgi:hypothetical protein
MRRQGLSQDVAEQARLLYESGLSVAAVGEQLSQGADERVKGAEEDGGSPAGQASDEGK